MLNPYIFPKSRLFSLILFIVLTGLVIAGCSGRTGNIVLENSHFRYTISTDGRNIEFSDRKSGIDYLDNSQNSACAYIIKDGLQTEVTSAALKKDELKLVFGGTGVTAIIRVMEGDDRISLKVDSVTGDPESLTFLNIPLSVEGMPYEPFGCCVLSMNLFTHVRQVPALMTHLWASCYKRFGLEKAEVVILGLETDLMLPAIRDVMEHSEGVPFSDKGGAWALMQKEGYGSYLMNFGTLTEETVDDWIKMCRSLGFNQIDNHGGGDFFRFGDFELNRNKWPEGWETYRKINDRLHDAGISSIFHTYAFFIDKNCSYVTPVPSSDLGYFNSFTLAAPVSEKDTEITVNESTAGISTITGFFVRNSLTLRIGSELVEFSGVTKTPPYRFTGCRRGALGTTGSAHPSGEEIFHLREMFGRFVPGPETALFNEIAANTARIVSECGFDGLYFDAIDGSDILAGEENFWYYGTKFIFEVARNLKKPVGMEMSSMSHHWWHYRSRWQAWDRPVRGYKRFIDIHSAAIKSTRLFLPPVIRSNENEHGLWRGHTPLIDKYAAAENGGLMLPLHLGWWGNQTWNPPQVEPTFPDDIEYLCCKMIGNNAGMSMLGGADEQTFETYPLFRRLAGIIKEYEELRQQDYLSDTVKAILRQPGKEFTLIKNDDGKCNFKPVNYVKHRIALSDHASGQWTIRNEFSRQPLRLRIEPLMSLKPFNDPSGITLAGFSGAHGFEPAGNAEGVTGRLTSSEELSPDGGKSCLFSADAGDGTPREGLWLKIEKKFEPAIDISANQGIGVWIKGDGNGELLNIRLESPKHLSHGARGDHFIKIDFTGWKYFELVEIESSEFSNYIWPDSGFYVYDSFRHTVLFNNIDKIQLWYNNLPSGREVNCLIGKIVALPLVAAPLVNPSVKAGGSEIIFPVRMEPGMFLEFRSPGDSRLYGSKGEFIGNVTVNGTVPFLKENDNNLNFSMENREGLCSRVQVTVITEGEPLDSAIVYDKP